MARFYGKIGYGEDIDQGVGVHELVITERTYAGDVVRNSRRSEIGERVNDDLTVSTSVSIVSDTYANEHFFAIRYVEWAGTLWKVIDVEVVSPRLVLRLGGVYNGPTGTPPGGP
jgi:hypothetical protein